MKFKKKIIFSILILLSILVVPTIAETNQGIASKLKADINPDRNKRIIEQLKPSDDNRNRNISEKLKVEPEIEKEKVEKEVRQKSLPKKTANQKPIQVQKEEVANTNTITDKEIQRETAIAKEDHNQEKKVAKQEEQYLTFEADNGRKYYVLVTRAENGEITTNMYSELSDERLQELSGENVKNAKQQKELDAKQKELEEKQKELNSLKNKEEPKKKSNLGTYILIIIVIGGVIGFKKFNDNKQEIEEFDEDDSLDEINDEDEDIEYSEYDFEDTEFLDDDFDLENYQEEIEESEDNDDEN